MLGEAGKERKIGPTEFPTMPFPHDRETTEKLVMAKDKPKKKEDTGYMSLFHSLSTLWQSKRMSHCLVSLRDTTSSHIIL